jgi:hypothetical protein
MKRAHEWARGAQKQLGEAGQSTIEFALTLLMLMACILFFLQLSLVMAFGNYIHYATFMAARAYLSAGPSQADQTERAQAVIVRMLKRSEGQPGVDRFPGLAKGEGDGDGEVKGLAVKAPDQFDPVGNSSWMQGVRYTFKSRLFLMPIGKSSGGGSGSSGSKDTKKNQMTLKSESWLGREPAYDECKQDLEPKKGIFDNGC